MTVAAKRLPMSVAGLTYHFMSAPSPRLMPFGYVLNLFNMTCVRSSSNSESVVGLPEIVWKV